MLDFDELSEEYNNKIITGEQLLNAIKSVNVLIEMVQNNLFPPEICDKYNLNVN